MIDIVKNFFVKYKFIPAKKMVDLGNVDNYKSMIEQGDNYIIPPPPKKELDRHDTDYDYAAHYKRMEKEREENRKSLEKSREESRKEDAKELKRMEKEMEKEAKRREKEEAKEAKRRRR
jgi:hypothetical protein